MAGIGWRLELLIRQGSLSGVAAAYATGAAVMALPWVLTTIVLVSLQTVVDRGAAELAAAETVVNVAYSVALLLDGPLQIVISRYTADRLYEGRFGAIAAPLCRGLGASFLLCHVTASVVLLALGLPRGAVLWGGALSAAVGAQWTALSVGNGLCSPGLVLGAVGAGAAQSVLLAATLGVFTRVGLTGYLFCLISGQTLTLSILLFSILRSLPEGSDEGARLLPAFRDYALLAGAGLAFNASLWIDKLVVWCMIGGETGARHATASTLAWFSTIPSLAWIFVEVETTFYRRFQSFYLALEDGASLSELRRGVSALEREAARLLFGAARVQAGVIVFLQLAAGPLARWLLLPGDAVTPFRLLLVGAGLHALTLLGLIILYYFDFRREALLAAGTLFAGIAACTMLASGSGLPPSVGTTLGCATGAVMTWLRVRYGIRNVLQRTLLGQPLRGEEMEDTVP